MTASVLPVYKAGAPSRAPKLMVQVGGTELCGGERRQGSCAMQATVKLGEK